MPTIELTDEEAGVLRTLDKKIAFGVSAALRPFGPYLSRIVDRLPLPPRPIVAGDIVRSNADPTIKGTVLGVSGGYVCFDTGNSHGYGNPFRIMLAELLERV